jgi:hypothetical protein
VSGSYILPWYDIGLAAKYNARAGDPLSRSQVFSFTNPTTTQPSVTVRVARRGEDRTDTVNKFLDLRASKRFNIGPSSVEATIDLFNVLNANHVLLQNENLGATWGRPTRVLAPRIVRFGVTARF